jgi:Uma2 family endonuclease
MPMNWRGCVRCCRVACAAPSAGDIIDAGSNQERIMSQQAQRQPFWEQRDLPAPFTPLSVAAFDALPETNIPIELIDGLVIYPHWSAETMSPSPTPAHQDIVLNVGALLKVYARESGGKAYIAPIDVDLDAETRVQPDAIYTTPDSACVRTARGLQGPPDLVVEVLSPGTAARDKTVKFARYEAAGVGEYWLIDPRDSLIEVYTRTDDGLRRLGAFARHDTFESPVLGGRPVTVVALFED